MLPRHRAAQHGTLGGALWPVTFVLLQVVTNVYFARARFWRILITGSGE